LNNKKINATSISLSRENRKLTALEENKFRTINNNQETRLSLL